MLIFQLRLVPRKWVAAIGTRTITAMNLQSRHILLDSIDFSTSWNLHPWEFYTLHGDLSASLARTGILHPPIVIAKEDNRFDIVCGFKRLLFAVSAGKIQQVNCIVLDEDTPPASILDIVLTDQGIAHPLSMAEKARFLEICTRYLQREEIVDTFCERLQLGKRFATLAALLEVLKQHPLVISEIHGGGLQEKMVMELLRLPEEADRIAMVKLFKNLSMGDGKQRKFLPLIRDLAYRHDTSLAAYLENPAIQGILHHPEMNNPQKIQHLAAFLQHQTNPLSAQAENEFVRTVRTLQLPENCTITHSPSFEKDEVTLSITFDNLSSCAHWIPKLKQNFI
ncbi:MAG: ParB protein [uncultured bacterium]|nr:MAG: ParB protein [uncultured bacterium]